MLIVRVALCVLAFAAALGGTLAPEYQWVRLSASADFPKSYNFQMFADSSHARVFHPGGVWSSADGITWRKTGLRNILGGQAFLDYVMFQGAVYALGTFEGNIERHRLGSQIARTTDFRSWQILAERSNLPARYFYHPFVFSDTLWIVGGADDSGSYDDAWQSADAVHWTKVATGLPFGKRAGQRFIVFRDILYMLDRDVWMSQDGRHWQEVTAKIADGEIFGYSVEIYNDQIWLIGCNRGGTFASEILRSPDGKAWTSERAPWTPRGGVATCLFKGRILMTGGKYGGPGIAGQAEFVYSNDVWALGPR
jgi:hypothetical protein